MSEMSDEEVHERIRHLIDDGVDDKWWGGMDKTEEEYFDLIKDLHMFRDIQEIKHSLFMNEILLGVNQWNDEINKFVEENDLVISDIHFGDRRNTEEGEFEVVIRTTRWLGGEFDKIKEENINREFESFVVRELELFPCVEKSFVDEDGDFVIEYNEELESTRRLREVTGMFNIKYIKYLSHEDRTIVFDGEYPFLTASQVVDFNIYKIQDFVNDFVLNEVGLPIGGYTFYNKETDLEFENDNSINFTRTISANFENIYGEEEEIVLEFDKWMWKFIEYTRGLEVPYFDNEDRVPYEDDENIYDKVYDKAIEESNRIVNT